MSNILEQNPIKTMIVIVLSALLLMDVAAANIYHYLFMHSFSDHNVERTYRIPSDINHHELARNVYVDHAVWGHLKYVLATDSLGFKSDRPKDTPNISECHRIVFMGDSFTEGIGIPYENTFVGRIAKRLTEQDIEVLNAAVSSYSPIIYYTRIQQLLDLGFEFDELVVFIDISDVLNEANHYTMSPDNTVKEKDNALSRGPKESVSKRLKKFIAKHSIVSHFILQQGYHFLFGNHITAHQLNRYGSMWTLDDSVYAEYGDEGLRGCEFYMSKLYDVLRSSHIPLTIAVYPWPDQIVNHDLYSIHVKYWSNWAQQKQVGFVNYFPCFIDAAIQTRMYSDAILDTYFISGDVHWNEAGHDLIAREFISYYNRQPCKCVEQGDVAAP